MEYVIIILVAFGSALLTFFSGFGLGTILMPVFAIFFPVEIAIALTATVHLANNLFKATLIWKEISWRVVLWFAIPAAAAAFGGAMLLNRLAGATEILTYEIGSRTMEITILKLVVAALLGFFSIMEINKLMEKVRLNKKLLPVGGILSGFFGGLSGHQGALRAMFLLKAGLTKEGFIATGVAAAIIIDISRLSVYGSSFFVKYFEKIGNDSIWIVVVASAAAFAGSFFGRKALQKITYRSVQLTVGVLILVLALLLAAGII
jgi:uncharacterized membrane protein YfcA